jgi:hypothetical protein
MKTVAADLPKCWLTLYRLYSVTLRKIALVKEILYRHSPAYAVVTFPKVWCMSILVQVEPQYTYDQLYVYTRQVSWNPYSNTMNLSSHSPTIQLPVLSTSSIPLLHKSYCAYFPHGKIESTFKKCYLNLFNFFLKLSNLGSVCTHMITHS